MTLTLEIDEKYPLTHKMFFFDCNWKDPETDQYIQDLFRKYFAKYVVGRETSKSGVLHYQANTHGEGPTGYTNMIAQLKRKYKLIGRARKGQRRQYGAVTQIRDASKALIYVLKENNYFSHGYDLPLLEKLQREESYIPPPPPKDKMRTVIDQVRKWDEGKTSPMCAYPNWGEPEEQRLYTVGVVVDLYFEVFDTLPTRNTLFKILYKAGILSSRGYAKMIAGSYIHLDKY